jgi:hypothetical protein
MGRWLDKAKSEPLFDGTPPLKFPETYVRENTSNCAHAACCPHSAAYLIEEFERTGKLRLEFEGSAVYLVRTQQIAESISDGPVYTLSEWLRISGSTVDQIRRDHRLSTMSGRPGSIQLKECE